MGKILDKCIFMGDNSMKKIMYSLICLVITGAVALNGFAVKGFGEGNKDNTSIQSSLEKKLIRFHVIANSDNTEDQTLKLKVRDKVLEYISPKLKNSQSIEESRQIIQENDENIKKVAQDVVYKNGYKYTISTTLSKENFPVKTYGNITLPQGEYEAYRILIGSGSGQNWWCVMFPPLCFIDIAKGEVSQKETEKTMKQVLTEKEYEAVDNSKPQEKISENFKQDENKEDNKIIIKFQIAELFNKLFRKK